jgi:hypothetical protein
MIGLFQLDLPICKYILAGHVSEGETKSALEEE